MLQNLDAQTHEHGHIMSYPTHLSDQTKLCIFSGTAATKDQILNFDNQSIDYELMSQFKCHVRNALACVTVENLHSIGFTTPDHFKTLGMDALDLHETEWLYGMIACFGSDAVRNCFLQTPHDAVCISNESIGHVLNVTPNLLLTYCKNNPKAACEVLKSWGTTDTVTKYFHNKVQEFIDCRLSKRELDSVGINLIVLTNLGATKEQLQTLCSGGGSVLSLFN